MNKPKTVAELRKQIRVLLAEYMATEGCSCCRDTDGHEKAAIALGKALGVSKYSDGSGYDFHKYRSRQDRG